MSFILSLILLAPKPAAHLVGWAMDEDPSRLIRICTRESRCRLQSVHDNDAWVGARAYENAVRAGELSPASCVFHHRGTPSRWATRGVDGLIAAYTVGKLPGCWPPWALDIPIISHVGAVLRLRRVDAGVAPPAVVRWAS